MTELRDLLAAAKAASAKVSATGNPNIRGALDAIDAWATVATELIDPAVTPPAPTGKLFGISPGTRYVPTLDIQAAAYLDLGGLCPRIGSDDTNAASMLAHGITHWFAWMDKSGTPAQAAAYLKKYPQCLGLELGNELNLDGAWTAQHVADNQKAFYAAAAALGVESRVMLSSVGNSKSAAEGLLPLDWCKKLISLGCKPGVGFTIANYHMYDADPQHYDDWMHVWTPLNGVSCQSAFGNPKFVVTEFGFRVTSSTDAATVQASEATQARAATAWVAKLASLPDCLGGHWFLSHDGVDWARFGLIDAAGRHRPAYQALKAAFANA